jgi:hypothetical protein
VSGRQRDPLRERPHRAWHEAGRRSAMADILEVANAAARRPGARSVPPRVSAPDTSCGLGTAGKVQRHLAVLLAGRHRRRAAVHLGAGAGHLQRPRQGEDVYRMRAIQARTGSRAFRCAACACTRDEDGLPAGFRYHDLRTTSRRC